MRQNRCFLNISEKSRSNNRRFLPGAYGSTLLQIHRVF